MKRNLFKRVIACAATLAIAMQAGFVFPVSADSTLVDASYADGKLTFSSAIASDAVAIVATYANDGTLETFNTAPIASGSTEVAVEAAEGAKIMVWDSVQGMKPLTKTAKAPKSYYTQDYTAVTDASTVMTSKDAQGQVVMGSDTDHGSFLAFDFSSTNTNSRGAYSDFGVDMSSVDSYIVEFDARLAPGNNQGSEMTIRGTDYKYYSNNVNYGTESGYILKMTAPGGSTTWTLNSTKEAVVPSDVWCHYKLYVDKTQGLVSTTITNNSTSEVILDRTATSYNGSGNLLGLYAVGGRYYPYMAWDNFVVRDVRPTDSFGELSPEVLSSLETSSSITGAIMQPDEGSSVDHTISVKAIGDRLGDLTEGATVEWSFMGLDKEDGYITFTGTDSATLGINVRNGVSNYYAVAKATVTYGEKTLTATYPFVVLGTAESAATQLAPAAGYPVDMNEYGDSLVGYAATSNAIDSKDPILNSWSIYGSNGARTLTLEKDEDGTKYLRFASNGGGGSTVGVYQLAEQANQYIVDMKVRFTGGAMSFGHYFNTPNNSNGNANWSASYGSGALTVGTQSIAGLSGDAWFRIVASADESAGVFWAKVYDSEGNLVGETTNEAMFTTATESQKYFCFQGTYPVDLASFRIYYPTAAGLTVNADAETVQVPETDTPVTVGLSGIMKDTDGYSMTGALTWSLADEYTGVTVTSDGAQSAILSVTNEAGAGAITVVASNGAVRAEKEIMLSTSGNAMAFTSSTSSITIPFTGEENVTATFAAEARDKDGQKIDSTVTYEMVDAQGEAVTNLRGVTFDTATGVLTVEAGAASKVVYIKASSVVEEETLTSKVKVNIHGLSFAFGSDDPADDSYTKVTSADAYTDKLGYGFADTSTLTDNAANVTGSAAYTFQAKVPNGNYVINVTTSSANMTSEVVAAATKNGVASGIAKSGTSFKVAVCDGILDLTFDASSTLSTLSITQDAAKSALAKPAIYAIGDSTTNNNANGAKSWGNCASDGEATLPETFSSFANHGMAGRNSLSYYNQGRLEAVLLAVCPGDYVTVNMGVNSTSGEPFDELMADYYVEGVIQRGAIPVLVSHTPLGFSDKASPYDTATGLFTTDRTYNGWGGRSITLSEIAEEKGLEFIDVGKAANDYFNSLTAEDVTAFNAANGTTYATVLDMVKGWYTDHNHYNKPLGIWIGNYIFGELEKIHLAADDDTVTEGDSSADAGDVSVETPGSEEE